MENVQVDARKDRRARNSDGTLRRSNRPAQLTDRTLMARFVEAETVRLKRWGLSFNSIAAHVTAVCRGEKQPVTPPPPGVQIPTNYKISAQGCHRAYYAAMNREPALQVAEHRRLDTERCEDMFLTLQSRIAKGDPRSIEAAVRVLDHKAKLNGLAVPAASRKGGERRPGEPPDMATVRDVVFYLDELEKKDKRQGRS